MQSLFSITQGNNLAIFAGLISVVLSKFHISIGSDELQAWLGVVISAVATLMQWIHRQKKGDLTVAGFRKSMIDED